MRNKTIKEETVKTERTAKKISPAELRRKNIQKRKHLRAVIQLIFFLVMPGAFTAGFNGVKYLFIWMGAGDMLQANSFVASLLALMIFTILFGRYFCGYICSFGTLGDFMSYISGIFQTKVLKRKKKVALPVKVLKVLQKMKYINLVFIVAMSGLGLSSALKGNSPWDVYSRLINLKGIPAGYAIGTICLILILIGMAVQERFFCQVLCPMGAVFAILPVLPIAQLKRNEPNCIKGCNLCANQCPVSLKLREDGSRSSECIACEKCLPTCPKGNISRKEDKLINVWWINILGKAVIFFILGCFMGWCRFL